MRKYSFIPAAWDIKAIIGEYDDPSNQKQNLLTLDFNNGCNTLIYGVSGKEIMLSSIIYSLIINHTSNEINIYIIDFGSEMFGTFVNAPQIGDVVFINESEKLYIIFINNYEALSENYEDYTDIISSLSREGEKYGISFVITASGVNAVRGKTSQNFNKQLCLQFNDSSDYASILGSTHGMVPSNIEGRGLIKIDNEIYEFQTAYPYKWDEINTFIKNICNQLNEKVKNKADKIAILPNHVRIQDISSNIQNIKRVPIGIQKNSLEISTFDFMKNPISLIATQDVSLLDKFVPSLSQVFQNIFNVELNVIDANEVIKDTSTFKNYYGNYLSESLDKLREVYNTDNNKINIFLIFGIETFMNAFDSKTQIEIKTILNNLKNKKNIRVVIADSVDKIKIYEYDDFYRNNVQANNAIWIGSGITEQFTIKSSTYNRETRAQIDNDFGYNVDRGNAILIKLLDFYTED